MPNFTCAIASVTSVSWFTLADVRPIGVDALGGVTAVVCCWCTLVNIWNIVELSDSDIKTTYSELDGFGRKCQILPVQFRPSPVYPGLHSQMCDPLVLLHTASKLQLCVADAHSSTSEIKLNSVTPI